MSPRDCPKYQACSAPLCPLDADWRLRAALPSEPLCFHLAEYGKEGAAARFEGASLVGIYDSCTRMLSDPALPLWMQRKVQAASVTGSRWDRGRRLAESNAARPGADDPEAK